MGEVRPLKQKQIEGFLSEKQLAEHHDVLYAGYVKKVDEIREKLKDVKTDTANATYSDLRELKVEETFATNGVRLHEDYFDCMSAEGKGPSEGLLNLIKRDFGSYENWANEFKACGLAARGWVVLAFDWREMRLRNFVCDVHNQGGVWNCTPLMVLDVYEHAYFLDYATGRKKYVEGFMENIDWEYPNKLAENLRMK